MPAAGRCMVGDVRSSSSLLRRICPKASPGPGLGEDSLLANPARGRQCREALREAMAEGVAFVPGVPFFPDGRGRTISGWPSAGSTAK
jgi:hypothetical protein